MILGMRAGNPAGVVVASEYYVKTDPDNFQRRILSWAPERSSGVVYHVVFDGKQYAVSDTTQQVIKAGNLYPTGVVQVIETSPQNRAEVVDNVADIPGDRVRATWEAVSGAVRYELYRKPDGGSYSLVYRTEESRAVYSYLDTGPLTDGTWYYKVVSYNAQENSTEDEQSIVVSAPPLAPSNVVGSWNPTTHVFTISWTASSSSDISHYAIRHNGGSGPIRLDDTPEDTTSGTSWQIDLTGLSGEYEFLVRAVDSSGNEEQNLANVVVLSVEVGDGLGRPGIPTQIQALPAGSSKAAVSFTYYPSREVRLDDNPIAAEARIYYDNKTGIIDWNTPLDTLDLNFPTAPDRYEWVSGALADGTYLLGVRIATDTGGAGVESQNSDEHEVEVDSSVPGATTLVIASS